MANRNNTRPSIRSDPRGLAVFELTSTTRWPDPRACHRLAGPADDAGHAGASCRRTPTAGDRNATLLAQGLAQMTRDSSFYYLLGYTRREVDRRKFPRSRCGSSGAASRARTQGLLWRDRSRTLFAPQPTPDVAKPIKTRWPRSRPTSRRALRAHRSATNAAPTAKTKVTLIWEPLTAGTRRDPAGRCRCWRRHEGNLLFRGRAPGGRAGDTADGAQRTSSRRRQARARLTVEGTDGVGTLDTETRTIDVPDLTRRRSRSARRACSAPAPSPRCRRWPPIRRRCRRRTRVLAFRARADPLDVVRPGTGSTEPTAS